MLGRLVNAVLQYRRSASLIRPGVERSLALRHLICVEVRDREPTLKPPLLRDLIAAIAAGRSGSPKIRPASPRRSPRRGPQLPANRPRRLESGSRRHPRRVVHSAEAKQQVDNDRQQHRQHYAGRDRENHDQVTAPTRSPGRWRRPSPDITLPTNSRAGPSSARSRPTSALRTVGTTGARP